LWEILRLLTIYIVINCTRV